MLKVYSRTKSLIRKRHKEGMSIPEIVKSFPKIKLNEQYVRLLLNKFKQLEWKEYNGVKYLKCNSCLVEKPYNHTFFQITAFTEAKTCRACRYRRKKNIRIIKKNTGKTSTNHILGVRRWLRYKIMRLIDINYYKTYIPKYIKENRTDVGYYRKNKPKKLGKNC